MNFFLPNTEKDLNNLTIEFPLICLIILFIIRLFTSQKLNIFYIIALILLPFCAYIIINKNFIQKYYLCELIQFPYLTYNDFFKLFFTGYSPYIFINYLSLFIGGKNTIVFTVSANFMIIYSSFISGKLLMEFILFIINAGNIKKGYGKELELFIKKDEKKIFLLYLMIYFLFSYIINI